MLQVAGGASVTGEGLVDWGGNAGGEHGSGHGRCCEGVDDGD